MKKYLFILIAFVTVLLLSLSCMFMGPSVKGNGHVTTEIRKIENFNKIKVSNGLTVILVQSDRELVTVEADENLHEIIRTELKRDELQVFTEGRIKKAKLVRIVIEFMELNELRSRAGARVKTKDTITVKRLATSASSGSEQNLSINTNYFKAKTSSGAHIFVQGKSNDVELKASSGSHLKGGDLSVVSCFANASSGAHIYIDVEKEFEGEASSGGHIYYSGSPQSVDVNTSSGGNINQK